MSDQNVIIVEPEIPENTGMIARLAANFDYSIRIVNPGFNLSEARKTASRAQEKLRQAEIYENAANAIRDLDYVVGTKPGKGKRLTSMEPSTGTSVMIGRESSGLTSEELEKCDAVAHIETGGYSSINQANAAAIAMHGLREKDRKGMNQGQQNKIEQLLEEKEATRETIIESNPSRKRAGKIIKELRKDGTSS